MANDDQLRRDGSVPPSFRFLFAQAPSSHSPSPQPAAVEPSPGVGTRLEPGAEGACALSEYAPPKRLQALIEKDAKLFEVVSKHYWDAFAYHASQRMTTIRYFLTAYSIFAAAYATLLKSDGWPAGAATLAVVAFILSVLFSRLDLRNEQLVHFAEVPLKDLQQTFKQIAGAGDDGWLILKNSDHLGLYLTTFGSVLPWVYALTASTAIAGFCVAATLAVLPTVLTGVIAIVLVFVLLISNHVRPTRE